MRDGIKLRNGISDANTRSPSVSYSGRAPVPFTRRKESLRETVWYAYRRKTYDIFIPVFFVCQTNEHTEQECALGPPTPWTPCDEGCQVIGRREEKRLLSFRWRSIDVWSRSCPEDELETESCSPFEDVCRTLCLKKLRFCAFCALLFQVL